MTDLFLGDDSLPRRRVHALGQLRLLCLLHAADQNPDTPHPTVAFDFGTPDTYRFYLNAGSLSEHGDRRI